MVGADLQGLPEHVVRQPVQHGNGPACHRSGRRPGRFVHVYDDIADNVAYRTDPLRQVEGNHGGINRGVSLFADGHVALVTYIAGTTYDTKVTPDYAVWFEDLPRPGTRSVTGATVQPR